MATIDTVINQVLNWGNSSLTNPFLDFLGTKCFQAQGIQYDYVNFNPLDDFDRSDIYPVLTNPRLYKTTLSGELSDQIVLNYENLVAAVSPAYDILDIEFDSQLSMQYNFCRPLDPDNIEDKARIELKNALIDNHAYQDFLIECIQVYAELSKSVMRFLVKNKYSTEFHESFLELNFEPILDAAIAAENTQET